MSETPAIVKLCELDPGNFADCFALLVRRDASKTRDGKPFYRVTFRDRGRTAAAMIWSDSAWFADCDSNWKEGRFYKIRCRYSETDYGPQIDIDRIREVVETDSDDGFNALDFLVSSRFDSKEMFKELLDIAETQITTDCLKQLVQEILDDNAESIQTMPAAVRNHHAYVGGFLEHVLSVTRTAVYLADKYIAYYPDMSPPLSKELVVAGAILHDIGKLKELAFESHATRYTAQGQLIGHILLGRDLVREKAATIPNFNADILLRLEHLIVSHQNLPEWGSPVSPHTPEALLVYFADDIDAKFHMMATALSDDRQDADEFTGRDNALRRSIFRGLTERGE